MKAPTDIDRELAPDPTSQELIDDLRELITALDRRVPRLERKGEIDIVRDAAVLRHGALNRIAALESSSS